MGRKRIVALCMESPLYFTMPLRRRLDLVSKQEQLHSSRLLRESILNWVRTGHFHYSITEIKRHS